jgi:hypothetical protein
MRQARPVWQRRQVQDGPLDAVVGTKLASLARTLQPLCFRRAGSYERSSGFPSNASGFLLIRCRETNVPIIFRELDLPVTGNFMPWPSKPYGINAGDGASVRRLLPGETRCPACLPEHGAQHLLGLFHGGGNIWRCDAGPGERVLGTSQSIVHGFRAV